MNKAKALRRQRNGKLHRSGGGLYYAHLGSNRFVVVGRSLTGAWRRGRVIIHGDVDYYLSHVDVWFLSIDYPTYRMAAEDGGYKRV